MIHIYFPVFFFSLYFAQLGGLLFPGIFIEYKVNKKQDKVDFISLEYPLMYSENFSGVRCL